MNDQISFEQHMRIVCELNRKLGLAEGCLIGVTCWDIPNELKAKINDVLKALQTTDQQV
jgi:hypothetical protein